MTVLTINTNKASNNAELRLAKSTASLAKTFERLSSGLRITRPGDDAAGLAIATGLDTDARVHAQGIRNFNDGVSLLNVAEGAAEGLSNIVIRLKELATQAANGTFSQIQRGALHKEAEALVTEYNRIVDVTEFNGKKLLNGTVDTLTLQGGYGTSGSISFTLGEDLERVVGDGTFQTRTSQAGSILPQSVFTADFNNDGKADYVASGYVGGIRVYTGNGDGTFASSGNFGTDSAVALTGGDFNNDGHTDIARAHYLGDAMIVQLGNGDGSFQAEQSYAVTGGRPWDITTADLNNDGNLDVISADHFGPSNGTIFLGTGSGSFQAGISLETSLLAGDSVRAEDLNDDGIMDLVAGGGFATAAMLGNGNGTFQSPTSISAGANVLALATGDFNSDGRADYISLNDNDTATLFVGNGDGTFRSPMSFTTGNATGSTGIASSRITASDLNGDGKLDFVVAEYGSNTVGVFIGNGDGGFESRVSYTAGTGPGAVGVADFNNDGALDLLEIDEGFSGVLLGNPSGRSSTLSPINLTSRGTALQALGTLDEALKHVSAERATIGANQSRLQTATGNLQQQVGNLVEAKSRILDADVSEEAANLIRGRILQQAGSAILAQANRQPELVLDLLKAS